MRVCELYKSSDETSSLFYSTTLTRCSDYDSVQHFAAYRQLRENKALIWLNVFCRKHHTQPQVFCFHTHCNTTVVRYQFLWYLYEVTCLKKRTKPSLANIYNVYIEININIESIFISTHIYISISSIDNVTNNRLDVGQSCSCNVEIINDIFNFK